MSLFNDADGIPAVGEVVLAVQPDDDGFEGVAPGVVRMVSYRSELIYTEVDWDRHKVVRVAT